MSLFEFDFMIRALAASAMVGVAAPAIGVFLVQRRLSLMGDGIGHMALTGVAVGVLTATSPMLGALVAAVIGAVTIELLRERGRTAGDVALAIIFYGGIAGGVFLMSLAPNAGTGLISFLFGSVLTVLPSELYLVAILSGAVLIVVAIFGRRLFAVSYDEEVARAAGLNVRVLSLLLAVMAAVTVVVAMRVVGLLLVAALMVIPVAAAQNLFRSFRGTALGAMGIGCGVGIGGVISAYYIDAAPGAAIVLGALIVYLVTLTVANKRTAR
jgi:zinc transport system permease protein